MQTDALYAEDDHFLVRNVTVTATTDFTVLWEVCAWHARACTPCMYAHVHPADPCMLTDFTVLWEARADCVLRITHQLASPELARQRRRDVSARPLPRPGDPSYVRVDSFQLVPLSRAMMLRPKSGQVDRMYRSPRHHRDALNATRLLFGLRSAALARELLSSAARGLHLHVHDPQHANHTSSPCTFGSGDDGR